jgi:hypothetical protein
MSRNNLTYSGVDFGYLFLELFHSNGNEKILKRNSRETIN